MAEVVAARSSPGSRRGIGLLGGAILTALVVAAVPTFGQAERVASRRLRVESDLVQLERAVFLFALDRGRPPADLEELVPEYLLDPPHDPWGAPYVYLPPPDGAAPREWTLLCLGGGDPLAARIHDARASRPRPLAIAPRRAPGPPAAPSDVSDLLPPLLAAGLAAALGAGVWLSSRLRGLRRLRGHADALLRALQQVRRPGPSVDLRPRPAPVRCAWCRDGDGDAGLLLCCPGCATSLHRECWGLAGRCPTLGCRRGQALARAAAASLSAPAGATIEASPVAAGGGPA